MDVEVKRAERIKSLVESSEIKESKLNAQHIKAVLMDNFGSDTGSKAFDDFTNGIVGEEAKKAIVEYSIEKKLDYINRELSSDGLRPLSEQETTGIISDVKDESEFFEFAQDPIDYATQKFGDAIVDWFYDAILSGKNIHKETSDHYWNSWEFEDSVYAFEKAEITLSPVAVDLNGDGINTLSQESEIFFDHDNNGMAENTGWISPDDGLLVLDRNSDGLINNGSELFGNNTLLSDGNNAENGYEAFKELDVNGDGVIDANDAAYTELRVWQDSNSDGISQSEELLTLEEVGIASLNTEYVETSQNDGNGNTIKQTSTATKIDGSTVDTADVWFGVNLTRTVETDILDLSEEVQALPDATAFGSVRSLRQAMMNKGDRLIYSVSV